MSWLCRVGGNSGREPRVQPGAGQVEGAVDVIYKTLRDCGLDHDEGPDLGGPVGP